MVTVRLATADDLGAFRQLWPDYLKTQEELGDYIASSNATLTAFESLFLKAVSPGGGAAVIAEDDGVPRGMMVRTVLDLPFDTNLGKVALSLGAYVQREYRKAGIYQEMVALARSALREIGVDSVMSEVLHGNAPAEAAADSVGYTTAKMVQVLSLTGDE
jgi:hypothetical protein